MQFAGDYKLDNVIVHSASGSIDIKDLLLELNVYESIHSSNLYGNITIMDSANHVQNMPIIGQEDIEFTVQTDEDTNTLDFTTFRGRIYKVNNMVRTEERQQVYTMHFCSKETMTNQRARVKSAYEGSGDEIVSKIFRDVLKTNKFFNVEPSDLKVKVVGNNMKPFDFINMVRDRCRSTIFDGSGYLFFENNAGFHFRSYESMLALEALHYRDEYYTLFYEPKTAGSMSLRADANQSVVESFEFMQHFDTLFQQASGTYANRVITHNLYDKSYNIKDYHYHNYYL